MRESTCLPETYACKKTASLGHIPNPTSSSVSVEASKLVKFKALWNRKQADIKSFLRNSKLKNITRLHTLFYGSSKSMQFSSTVCIRGDLKSIRHWGMTSSASNVKILFWKMAAVFPMQGLVQVSVQSPGISVTILAVLYVVYIIIIRVFTKTFGSIGLSLQNEIMKSNNEFWKVPNSMVWRTYLTNF